VPPHSRRLRCGKRTPGRGAWYNSDMNDALLAQAKKLPISERLELISALWDTLDSAEIPVTREEREVLEARMADIEANPSAEESWSEAKVWLESRSR
jgi:putative addiction module component (TIGR02574 family)